MTNRTLAGAIIVSWFLLLPCTVEAQQRSLSLDATVGMGHGRTTGEYVGDRRGVALDLLMALRLRPAIGGALVAGLNASAQGPFVGQDLLLCLPSPDGDCARQYPAFATLGALVGWENSSATLRVLAGAAYAESDAAAALAVQGRVEAAVPIARHLALVASARGTMIPNYRGDAFSLLAFGAGIRIY